MTDVSKEYHPRPPNSLERKETERQVALDTNASAPTFVSIRQWSVSGLKRKDLE